MAGGWPTRVMSSPPHIYALAVTARLVARSRLPSTNLRGWRFPLLGLCGPDNRQRLFDHSAHPRRQFWIDPVDLWMIGAIMTHDAAVLRAREIASRVLAPSAGQNDKAGRFSTEAVESLGESGLLGLLLPVNVRGSGLGPRTFAVVTATLAEADASVAMVYLMHVLGTATIS